MKNTKKRNKQKKRKKNLREVCMYVRVYINIIEPRLKEKNNNKGATKYMCNEQCATREGKVDGYQYNKKKMVLSAGRA